MPPLPPDTIEAEYDEREDLWVLSEAKYTDDRVQFLAPACKNEFSEEEMDIIVDLVRSVKPKSNTTFATDQYDYLLRKYHELNVREKSLSDKGQKINNRFAYLKALIEADMQESAT